MVSKRFVFEIRRQVKGLNKITETERNKITQVSESKFEIEVLHKWEL